MNALEVKGLHKSFAVGLFQKDVKILTDVSFALKEGRTTGFVGVNGSGKTTSIKCILDFVKPDKGDISFWGQKFCDLDRSQLGYLPERPYLYEFLTAKEFLKFHWDLCFDGSKDGFENACETVLAEVNLAHAANKKIRNFSKGMLQRTGIAQAILTGPRLIILDEPMSGLDPDGRILVKTILKKEKGKGTTLFFSSHLLQDMEELCDDLVIIDKGKIRFVGDMSEFKNQAQSLEDAFRELRQGEVS
ncbi:MAG: ABC transporter ATP-binding protein [Bdellovibrionia bacterium]